MISYYPDRIMRTIGSVIDLFLPRSCPGCRSTNIDPDEELCLQCAISLPYTGFENLRSNPVEKLFWGRLPFGFASTTCYFLEHSPIQQIVHAIKYSNQQQLAISMGQQMGLRLLEVITHFPIDLLIPMPLHPVKQNKRGYNQAELLCNGISYATGIPIGKNEIQRTLQTETQTQKSRSARWNNVSSAFSVAHPESVFAKHILLVDDVITTGASMEACGHAALSNGAASVSFSGLAFTA